MPSLRIASSRSRTTAAVSRLAASNRFSSAASAHFRYSASDAKSARFLDDAAGGFVHDGARASASCAAEYCTEPVRNPARARLDRRLAGGLSPPAPPARRARSASRTSRLRTLDLSFSRVLRAPPRLPPPDASPRRRALSDFRLRLETRPALGFFASPPRGFARLDLRNLRARQSHARCGLLPQTVPSRRSDRPEPRRRAAFGPAPARAPRRSCAARSADPGGDVVQLVKRENAPNASGSSAATEDDDDDASSYARLRSRPRLFVEERLRRALS